MAPTQVAHDIHPVPVPTRKRFGRREGAMSHTSMGLIVAIVSCAAFGTSGSFAKALLGSGWTPVTAVAARITIAAFVLAVPTALALRGRWHTVAENWKPIVLYGIFGVAGCQLFYFNAVTHVSVGVALLIEYLAPVLLVGWAWARYGRTPRRLTVAGMLAAIVGLLFVLDVFSGLTVDLVGVAWAFGAALCLVVYFIIASDDESSLPSIALAGGGMVVGALILLAICAVQAMPTAVSTQDVAFSGSHVPFWVPVLGLAVIAAALAYATGIYAARVLGSTVASFISLLEVLFAVAFAWMIVGEVPTLVQAVGGLFIVGGVVLVRVDESRHAEAFGPVVAAEHDEEVTRWLDEAQAPVVDDEHAGGATALREAARS